jgi:hypothetical protein
VLTGSLGSQSLAFSDLFTGPARAWSFGLSLLQPLINANRNRYQVDAQRDLFDAELQLVLPNHKQSGVAGTALQSLGRRLGRTFAG